MTLNRSVVKNIWAYLGLGLLLWIAVFLSGLHATLAGVVLALAIPLKVTPGSPEASHEEPPLHKLEHALQEPVPILIVPVFGFANAGVSFAGASASILAEPVTIGVAAGLSSGSLRACLERWRFWSSPGWRSYPRGRPGRRWRGVSLLCGIGFTMSLFIGLLLPQCVVSGLREDRNPCGLACLGLRRGSRPDGVVPEATPRVEPLTSQGTGAIR